MARASLVFRAAVMPADELIASEKTYTHALSPSVHVVIELPRIDSRRRTGGCVGCLSLTFSSGRFLEELGVYFCVVLYITHTPGVRKGLSAQ